MIITLLFIIFILLGLILMKKGNDTDTATDIDLLGAVISVISSMILFVLLFFIIVMHVAANNYIQKNKIEYEGLCKRYEIVKSEYEDVSKSDVIADITAWNIKVYNIKYWSENPWTNWFNPRKIADNLYYISLEEDKK